MQIDANLPFYEAFRLVQIGSYRYMRLPHWKEDVEIHMQLPDDYSKMTHPYLYVKSRFGLVPWIPTQVEMFSEDWEVHIEDSLFCQYDDVPQEPELGAGKPTDYDTVDDAFNMD